jgi:hypothetical protein
MMAPNEFRRGNLFMDKVSGKWEPVIENERIAGATLQNREMYPLKNGRQIVPIPITMEILENCDKIQLEKVQGLLMVSVDTPARLWWLGIEKTKQQIKALHELQNWYYLETGEELRINYNT